MLYFPLLPIQEPLVQFINSRTPAREEITNQSLSNTFFLLTEFVILLKSKRPEIKNFAVMPFRFLECLTGVKSPAANGRSSQGIP